MNSVQNNTFGGEDIPQKSKKIVFEDGKITIKNQMDDDKINEKTRFYIGSCTKTFTMISLLQLHDKGIINVYDPIGKYLDYKQISDIPIIKIMNHCAGLKRMFDGYATLKRRKFSSMTEVLQEYGNDPIIDQKLQKTNDIKYSYSYSNAGYNILGALIEKVTDSNYLTYFKTNIIIPLDMKYTDLTDDNFKRYRPKPGQIIPITGEQQLERYFAGSSGALSSCIEDMVKFANFPSLLTPTTQEILKNLYFTKRENDRFIISHTGGMFGGKSEYVYTYTDLSKKPTNIYVSLGAIF